MRKADVRGQPPAEERARPSLGAIEELIGNDDVERCVFLLQAADGAGRQDVLDPEELHAEDVGAEVELRRQDPVPGAVPREKRDAAAAQRPDQIRPRRLAERRGQRHFLAIGHAGHVVQAAAADDAYLDVFHSW
jgi:hypothetical protein